MITKHEGLKRFAEAQKAVDGLHTMKVMSASHIQALRSVSRILLSGTTLALNAPEADAVKALGESANMAGQTLRAIMRDLECGGKRTAQVDAAFKISQLWSGRLLTIHSESRGEEPAIIAG